MMKLQQKGWANTRGFTISLSSCCPTFQRVRPKYGSTSCAPPNRRSERAKAPFLAKIKGFAQHEGTAHSYDRIGAKAVTDEGFEAIAIPVTIDVSEIPDLVGEKLAAKIDAVADGLASKRMEMFYRKMNEVTEEVGNAMDMKGAPLTQDAFFTILERVDVEFGPDNLPTSVWHTTPALAEVIGKWDEELLDRKRNEWRDRESNRKLVE